MPYSTKDKHNKHSREYSRQNPEKVKEYRKRWRDKPENKEKERLYRQQYQKTPSWFYSSLANRKRHKVLFSRQEFIGWYNQQEKECYYCGIPENIFLKATIFKRGKNSHRLEIDRKDSSESYKLNNIVLSCPICNVLKSNIFSVKETKEISQNYIKPKWQKYV